MTPPSGPPTGTGAEQLAEARRQRQALAAAALARGQAALAGDTPIEAVRWLDRARRIAGGNDTVTLLLASALLRAGRSQDAIPWFRTLADRHDLAEAWLGLAAACRQQGDQAGAATALHGLLAGHVVPSDPSFHQFADAIAGVHGWCGIDDQRRLVPVTAGRRAWLDGRPVQPDLPMPSGSTVSVLADGIAPIGSPLRLDRMDRMDGFVAGDATGLSGWAWHPGQPERVPMLRLVAPDGSTTPLAVIATPPTGQDAGPQDRPLMRRHYFAVTGADLPPGPVRVIGPNGRDLPGSPVDPPADVQLAQAVAAAVAGVLPAEQALVALRQAPVPAALRGPRWSAPRRPRATTVVIPVYGARVATLACLASVAANTPGTRIVVVDDASPDRALADALDSLSQAGVISLIRHPANRGFPAAANTGVRASAPDDVVLLNADTLVPPGWLPRLCVAAAAPDIASASPLSNDATLLSYPAPQDNPVPDQAATDRLDRACARANPGAAIDIPTTVGFCMWIGRDALDAVGLLREDLFAQGYGEENDFCIRARHLGFRHVAAAGVFVAHVGGQSFGASRTALLTRNLAILNRLHPGYDALIAAEADPPELAAARRRIDLGRLARRRTGGRSVILITHDLGGGVQRQIGVRCAALRAAGDTPIVIRPELARPLLQGTGRCIVDIHADLPNLVYDVGRELPPLVRLLAARNPRLIELHHMLGHDRGLMALPAMLGVPYEVHVHDYAWFCPRVSLIGPGERYCGEPDLAGCANCIADLGRNIDEAIPVADLVSRSAAELAGAQRVIAPSADTAARLRRHFPGLRSQPLDWDDIRPQSRLPAATGQPRTVAVLGAIGVQKGYDVLLACARDAAARNLPLRFVVIGYSTDDQRLIDTGRVFVTGEYGPAELPALIADHGVAHAFLPSIWPETWCFTLSEAWQAGLHVTAFDLGAPAERIRAHGGGTLIPLGMQPPQINAVLLR